MSTFWDRVARFYDLSHWTNRAVNAAAAARAAELVPSGAKVLDCAAGTGEFSLAAAEKAESVLCTDLSEAMLKQAAKKAAKRGFSNLKFAVRDLTALPAPVRELWRVTAPGGLLLLPTYLQGKAGEAYGTMIKIYQGVGFHYEHAFTPESYQVFLKDLALAPVSVEVISGRLPEGIAVLEKPV